MPEDEALNIAENVLLSLKYEKRPNDWESWAFLDAERLEEKKKERSYVKEDFEISYTPEPLKSEYRALGRFHLHFYENKEYVFSSGGFQEYKSIAEALASAGLALGQTDDADRKHYREVYPPEWFNAHERPPSLAEHAKNAAFGAFALGMYALIILWPGFRAALRLFSRWRLPRRGKQLVFVLGCSVALAPAPMPLSMFGPVLIVPFPMVAPVLFGNVPATFLQLVAISFLLTLLVSAVVSRRLSNAT